MERMRLWIEVNQYQRKALRKLWTIFKWNFFIIQHEALTSRWVAADFFHLISEVRECFSHLSSHAILYFFYYQVGNDINLAALYTSYCCITYTVSDGRLISIFHSKETVVGKTFCPAAVKSSIKISSATVGLIQHFMNIGCAYNIASVRFKCQKYVVAAVHFGISDFVCFFIQFFQFFTRTNTSYVAQSSTSHAF